ncbi:MAG: Putative ABC transporter ATP binding protein [uncultured Sulfurovum sp.]|uniref:ABC transporter ATP binding protein n=1 Tax=uncultured Sulfurovum sp. TaxID=269237 RepID=A0A6S6TQ12_9BACT|nr:MAG: Putative ABC transporter ATP binding protein [uncultured Sulfurovum sp.]
MSKTLLEATSISHSFDTLLFSDVDFTLLEGQSMAIVGRSGSGKSTLMHIASTFIEPKEGSVKLFGSELYTQSEEQIEQLRRYDLGIVFQSHYLFKGMSVVENINVATMLSGESIDEALLEKLEIQAFMNQKISELSGGQQQRVSIARVLSKKPRIIFADEPTGNLDKATAMIVMDTLMSYVKENKAGLVLVTHDEELSALCDITARLEEKRLIVSHGVTI